MCYQNEQQINKVKYICALFYFSQDHWFCISEHFQSDFWLFSQQETAVCPWAMRVPSLCFISAQWLMVSTSAGAVVLLQNKLTFSILMYKHIFMCLQVMCMFEIWFSQQKSGFLFHSYYLTAFLSFFFFWPVTYFLPLLSHLLITAALLMKYPNVGGFPFCSAGSCAFHRVQSFFC